MEKNQSKNTIGKNLRILMWDNRLKQKDIAKTTGLTTATISKFVNGKAPIGSDYLMRLNAAYGVSIDWLLFDRGEMYLEERKLFA